MDFSAVTCHTLRLDVEESWHLEGFKMAAVTYWKLSWSIELIYSCILVMSCSLQSWRSTSPEASSHNIFALSGSFCHKLEQEKIFNNINYSKDCTCILFKKLVEAYKKPKLQLILQVLLRVLILIGCLDSQCWIKALLMAYNLLTTSMFGCI